ncbi:MAG: hypothetical protein R3253_14315 [Longimicrobiales bacterium]|nr:hypothetical protein [Longimicrobiales bacterium]
MGKKRKKKSKSRKKRQRQQEPVDAVIDLDEDLDAAELIAAAANLDSASEEGADEAAEARTAPVEDASAAEGEDEPAERGEEAAAEDGAAPSAEDESRTGDRKATVQEATDAARAVDTATEESPEEPPEAPLIGPDALVALSEFREEGVATVPEELILDLGDTTSPDERDRLLAAALAHVEMQDAIYRVPLESGTSRRWKGLLAAALFVMALFVAGLPPAFLVPDGPAPLTTAERTRGIRQALLLQAQQIEAFQATADRLPRTLAEVETALPGIRFVRSSNRLYQLIAYAPTGEAVVYDSAAPDPAFAEVASSMLSAGGDS